MDNAIQTNALRYRAGKEFEIRDLALNVPQPRGGPRAIHPRSLHIVHHLVEGSGFGL